MYSSQEIISFMDLLDLDEEVINLRAQNLMKKNTLNTQHLINFTHLLQYKQLINIRENSECDNEAEYHFVGKLITNIQEENIEVICKIIMAVLNLNPSNITFKSEHLIQQILSEICLPIHTNVTNSEIHIEELKTTLLHLKICGSILDANEKSNTKLLLPFLSTPLENIVCCKDEKVVIYFLTNTVPRFFTTVEGYNIVDRIWHFLKELSDEKTLLALRVLCCLSNYYLPVEDSSTREVLDSHIIFENKFWDFLLLGLSSEFAFARKQSIYLAKRAIDYLMTKKKDVSVTSKSTFVWNNKNKENLKKMWDNFFILIESLEEKQSNIVLPSLKLFSFLKDIGRYWLNCAFNLGLKHDNTQVRLKSLHYHFQYGIHNECEAVTILKAINDLVLFDHDYMCVMKKFNECLKDSAILMRIVKTLPLIRWSPVPLYHVTKTINNFNGSLLLGEQAILIDFISDLSKILCNNVIIRKCIHINLSYLIGNCCKDLNWRKYIPLLQLDNITKSKDSLVKNPLKKIIMNMSVPQEDMDEFFNLILLTYANIDFAFLYFEEHKDEDFPKFIDQIMYKIEDISKRQYSDKTTCLKDVIFVVYLYNKSLQKSGGVYDKINLNATNYLKIILQYLSSTLISNMIFDIEKIRFLFENLDQIMTEISNVNETESTLKLCKSAVLCLQDKNTIADKKVLSVYILCNCLKSPLMVLNYKHELLDFKSIIDIIVNVNFIGSSNTENTGRLRNTYYEKSCEIIYILLNRDNSQANYILDFINMVIESGGYGCLKWILMIMNRIFSAILDDENNKFNVIQFLNRMWIEIEELKSNGQYPICFKEFVKLITQDKLLEKSMYNNVILTYCSKIIDYAAVKTLPLFFLVNQLNQINVFKYSHMVYILSEILLNPVIAMKEIRIVENVLLEILKEPIYGADKHSIYFSSHIQFLAVSTLSKISDPKVLNSVAHFMIKKIDELFKNKQRYHRNSHHQRSLQACIQNLLFILLKSRKVNFEITALWCMEFLGRIPHQPYERICLEWYISLYFYLKETVIIEEILEQLKSKNVPLSSQFTVMYWIVVHKLKYGICISKEFEFLMNLLLSHIMGPVFSTRLLAQYLSSMLYEANEISKKKLDNSQYAYMISVINRTLQDMAEVEDKSFKKLKNDYFVTSFDVVEDLIPCEIYWVLPQLVNALSNDIIEDGFLRKILNDIDGSLSSGENDRFHNEWKEKRRNTTDALRLKANHKIINNEIDNLEETGTIQKKYVPWKNMSDVDGYNNESKSNKTNLIVVASLIDKLPNLGGMARTSEVFGVQTYVVDSVRHLQDKQFQGLSVSAERWVPVEEIRPGQPLKDYLLRKKAEGYSLVAAEQTSTSTKLQSFKFPKKTLLLLGNEKEGVPCDLLPLMDQCVEIPQQGVIRSLNVHVTAAIFIWEYVRQNML